LLKSIGENIKIAAIVIVWAGSFLDSSRFILKCILGLFKKGATTWQRFIILPAISSLTRCSLNMVVSPLSRFALV